MILLLSIVLTFATFHTSFAQDITRIHGYVTQAQSGYTPEEESEEPSVKSARIYKVINRNADGIQLEEAIRKKNIQEKQYNPIIQGALNQFYQNSKEQQAPVIFTERTLAQSRIIQEEQKRLSHYISFNIGRPLSLTMNNQQDDTTQTLQGQNEIYQGIAGFYLGKVLETLPFVRFEYGAQYEVLSFTEETTTQYNSIRNHNATATIRTFIDIPVFPNLAISIGGEGGIGLFQHFYNQITVRTFGTSYAALGGLTFVLSKDKSFYLLGRYGIIPKVSLNYPDNTTKNASFSSVGLIAGMQFFI